MITATTVDLGGSSQEWMLVKWPFESVCVCVCVFVFVFVFVFMCSCSCLCLCLCVRVRVCWGGHSKCGGKHIYGFILADGFSRLNFVFEIGIICLWATHNVPHPHEDHPLKTHRKWEDQSYKWEDASSGKRGESAFPFSLNSSKRMQVSDPIAWFAEPKAPTFLGVPPFSRKDPQDNFSLQKWKLAPSK